jgi:protein SCO1/2
MCKVMKTNLNIRLLAFAMFALVATSCTHQSSEAPSPMTELQTVQPQQGSLYSVPMTLDDQNGQKVEWNAMKGKTRVISMIFTHCLATCPIITEQLKQAQHLLSSAKQTNVTFSLVSFDSKRDTSARLKEEFDEHGLNSNWQLLHAFPNDVQTIAALLDIRYKEWPDGSFTHSNVIVIVNETGQIVYRLNSIDPNNPKLLASAINSMK